MFYYLYEIRNNLNGKIYVGVHKTKSLDDGYMGSGKIIRAAIAKHGAENFTKTILEHFESKEEMYSREKEVVTEEFLAREDTYNLRRGGLGGFDYINQTGLNDRTGITLTDQQKRNVSVGRKKSITDEFRIHQKQRMMGNKIGIGNRGGNRLKSKEHKDKIRNTILQSVQIYEPVTCPHCNKNGAKNGMKRWHFDKCKYLRH